MYCTKCGYELKENESVCPECGAFISYANPSESKTQLSTPYANVDVPSEVKGWNWGAFTFGIFWGIGNYTYLPLLCLIPIFNIVWIFVCGFKGNEWAWKSGKFNSVESFIATQKTWNRAGLVSFIIGLTLFALYFVLLIALFSSISYY